MSIEGNQNFLYLRNQEGKKLAQKAFKANVSKSYFANSANKAELEKLFSIFDKNNSGILENDELQSLWTSISTINTNGNQTIDENEAINYLSGLNKQAGTDISQEVLYEFLSNFVDENVQISPTANPVSDGVEEDVVADEPVLADEGHNVMVASGAKSFKAAFQGRNVVSAKIDGASTGITNKNYTGQIIIPKGAQVEEGKYPSQLRMSLPAGYSGSMILNLVDEENGIYETRAHDRQFQVTVGEDGSVNVGTVHTEELDAKLQANRAQYAAKAQANKGLKQYKVNGELCETIGTDAYGRTYVRAKNGKEYAISHDGKVLRDDYVEAHANYAAGKSKTTLTNETIAAAKASNGRVYYFSKQGKALSKKQSEALVKAEGTYIANKMYDAAKGWGTKNEQLAEALSETYSRAVLQEANRQLATKDKDYRRSDATPVEGLIINEANNRAQAREWFTLLLYEQDELTGEFVRDAQGHKVSKGVLSVKENAQMVKREMAHAGKKTVAVAEVNELLTSRDARVELEAMYEAEAQATGLQKNDGSYLRAVWAQNGLSPEDVDIADLQLVENGLYDHEHDQEHRNALFERTVFGDSENAMYAGLKAVDDAIYFVQNDDGTYSPVFNPDLEYIYQKADEQNQQLGYEQQVTSQDPIQTYFAGRMTVDGKVDGKKVGICNTNLYKGEKPDYIQAQEAIYAVRQGNADKAFASMNPNFYQTLAYYVQNGDIEGVNNIRELYEQAINTKGVDKTYIKANAIISGQMEFSDEEVTDFCIQLMHSADMNLANARSSGYNSTDANTAENNVEQLKLILQSHPQIHNAVIAKMKETSFGYSVTTTNGFNQEGQMPTTTTEKFDRNDYWNDIMDNMLYQADEAVFLDENGEVQPAEYNEYYTEQYNIALQGLREYVGRLERDFNMQVNGEGALSEMANNLSEFSNVGTDREDVRTQYIQAKTLLQQLEIAAQGKLRDSEGNVVSVDDLLNNCPDLEGTNQSYKSTISAGKTAIMLAPVIATTAIVAAPAAAGGSAAATALGAGATVAKVAGGAASVIAGSTAAGLTHYGTGMVELRTSATGNTKAAREQLAADAVNTAEFTALAGSVAGASQGIRTGANLIKPLAKFNSTTLGKVVSNVVFLGGDMGLYVAGENAIDASKSMNISSEGETIALVNSFAGYGLAKPRGKVKPEANTSINRQPFGVNDADIPASHKIDMSVPKVETPVQKPKRVQHNFQNQQAKNKAVDMAQRIENARSLDELRAIEQECRQLGNKRLIKKLQVRMQEANLPGRTPESPAVSVKPKAQGNVTEFNPVTGKYESVTPEKAKELRKMQQVRPELSPNENPATVKREGTIEFEATFSTPKVSMPIASNPIENLSKESDMLKYLKNEKHMLNHDVNVYQMQDGTFIVRSKQNIGFRKDEFFEKFDAQGQKIGNVEANEATALVANQPTIDFENAIKVEVKPLGTSSSMPRQDNFGQQYRPAASGNQPRAQFGGDNPPVQHLTPENPTAGMNIHSDGVPASEPRNPIGFQFGNTAKPSFDRQKADLIEKIDFAIIKFEKSTKPEDINLVKQLKELKHNVSQITDNTGVIQQLNASNNRFAYQVTNNIEDINRLYQEFDDALYMGGDLRHLIDKAEHVAINDVSAANLAAGGREVRTYHAFPTEPKPTVNNPIFKPNAEIPIEAVQSEFSKLIDNELYFLKGSARDNYDLLKNMVRKCNDTEALQRALESFKKRSDRNNARILAQQLARI